VEVANDRRQAFAASGEHWRLGSTLIGRYRTTARRVVRTPNHIRRDGLDHWVLRVMIRGVLVSRALVESSVHSPARLPSAALLMTTPTITVRANGWRR
jgi:hypothetical protein